MLHKMCKYEMDLASIGEDTERTQFCPQTDGRTDGQRETSIPLFQLCRSGGYNNSFTDAFMLCMNSFVFNFGLGIHKHKHMLFGLGFYGSQLNGRTCQSSGPLWIPSHGWMLEGNHWMGMDYRADSRFVPSQWETALLCNGVSHWLGTSLDSALE